jgi:hypothetical protein
LEKIEIADLDDSGMGFAQMDMSFDDLNASFDGKFDQIF